MPTSYNMRGIVFLKVTGRGENPHLNIHYYGPEWPIRIVKLLHHFVLGYIADSKTLHQDKLANS